MKIYGDDSYGPLISKPLKLSQKWAAKPKSPYFKNHKQLLKFNKCLQTFREKDFHKGYRLIISSYDLQTGALLAALKKQKTPFLYIQWDEFVKSGAVVFASHPKQLELKYKHSVYDLKKATSIYYDYTDLHEVFYFKRNDFTFKEQIFIRRWLEVLECLEKVLPNVKCIPAKPSLMQFEAQNKFGEALLASQVGLKIPKMIFTNEPKDLQKFAFDHTAILKDSGLRAYYGKGKILKFKSKKIDPLDPKLVNCRLAPCVAQEFLDKKYDLRVYVVGNTVLPLKIESKTTAAKFDWRGQEQNTIFSKTKIPNTLTSKLKKFTKLMGFRFASFDLVLDQKGDYYFLEMNRPGQWFFAELLSGVEISKALAKNLK